MAKVQQPYIAGEMCTCCSERGPCTCCSERGPTQCQLVQCLAVTAGRPAAPEREGHVLQVQERVGHMFQVQERGGGGAHAPGTGDGAGDIKRCERSGRNVMPLMSTLCMHTQRRGCPMYLDCCYLTARSDTQCNVCTTRLQLYVRIGVQCETDM